MAQIVDPQVEAYAAEHTTPDPQHLAGTARLTDEHLASPGMMVGPIEGRLLQMLAYALDARNVLEIGTFSGYSALAMAEGLAPGGRIVTCEIDPVHAAAARRNIAASPYADRIEVVEGPALQTIEGLGGPFDLVFIDADKEGYRDYLRVVLPRLSERGIVAVDNTLWYGTVLDDDDSRPGSRAIRAFNDAVCEDENPVCV
jgi:caffeoyl-CoA O-methyltransferase